MTQIDKWKCKHILPISPARVTLSLLSTELIARDSEHPNIVTLSTHMVMLKMPFALQGWGRKEMHRMVFIINYGFQLWVCLSFIQWSKHSKSPMMTLYHPTIDNWNITNSLPVLDVLTIKLIIQTSSNNVKVLRGPIFAIKHTKFQQHHHRPELVLLL